MFSIPPQDSDTSTFKLKYNKTQKQLQSIAAVDDLLSGMLPLNLDDQCLHQTIPSLFTTVCVRDAEQKFGTNSTCECCHARAVSHRE